MTTNVAEREQAPVLAQSFVETAERVPTTAEAAEMAERWVENPAERMTSQLEELALLYAGRTDRQVDYWNNRPVHESNSFATRRADGSELEEVYTIDDSYTFKEMRARSYSVKVFTGEGSGYRLGVSDQGMLRAYMLHGDKETPIYGQSQVDDLVFDFFHRSLDATVRSTDRDWQDRDSADADALAKLERRFMITRYAFTGNKVSTSLE